MILRLIVWIKLIFKARPGRKNNQNSIMASKLKSFLTGILMSLFLITINGVEKNPTEISRFRAPHIGAENKNQCFKIIILQKHFREMASEKSQ